MSQRPSKAGPTSAQRTEDFEPRSPRGGGWRTLPTASSTRPLSRLWLLQTNPSAQDGIMQQSKAKKSEDVNKELHAI